MTETAPPVITAAPPPTASPSPLAEDTLAAMPDKAYMFSSDPVGAPVPSYLEGNDKYAACAPGWTSAYPDQVPGWFAAAGERTFADPWWAAHPQAAADPHAAETQRANADLAHWAPEAGLPSAEPVPVVFTADQPAPAEAVPVIRPVPKPAEPAPAIPAEPGDPA